MTIRSFASLAAVLGLGLAACNEQPTAPAAATKHLSLAADAASDSASGRSLLYRSDSLSRNGFISWSDGTLSYYVFVSETQDPGTRTAYLGYGAYNPWTWETAFYGGGPIPATDVTGSGIGDLRVRTNTSAIPGFWLYNDPGGPVDIAWKQVPGSGWRIHFNGRNEWPPFLFVGEGRDMGRVATVSGSFAGHVIPDSVQASLYQSLAHSEVFLLPGY